jgi:hypothetical protein
MAVISSVTVSLVQKGWTWYRSSTPDTLPDDHVEPVRRGMNPTQTIQITNWPPVLHRQAVRDSLDGWLRLGQWKLLIRRSKCPAIFQSLRVGTRTRPQIPRSRMFPRIPGSYRPRGHQPCGTFHAASPRSFIKKVREAMRLHFHEGRPPSGNCAAILSSRAPALQRERPGPGWESSWLPSPGRSGRERALSAPPAG